MPTPDKRVTTGLTLLEHIATQVLAASIGASIGRGPGAGWTRPELARDAVTAADALIDALDLAERRDLPDDDDDPDGVRNRGPK